MKILIVTDAWRPQVNGVVRTLTRVIAELGEMGHTVEVIHPGLFRTMPAPSYPEIRLALRPGRRLARFADRFGPDAIHLATEGPLGWAGRRYCLRRGLPYTTSYTTRFPEYLHARWRLPLAWSYAVLRRFHNRGAGTLVATASLRRTLEAQGFTKVVGWTRGVDTTLFRPRPKDTLDLPRPVFLYAGRVAVEKNIEAFLEADLPGTKLVVGSGPQLPQLQRRYPTAVFAGYRENGELAAHYAAADVFVFPSRSDTFGLVMLEALASGVPVAAYPVAGPLDVIGDSGVGVLDEDLASAARRALGIDPAACRRYAERFSWRQCAELLVERLAPIRAGAPARPDPAPAEATSANAEDLEPEPDAPPLAAGAP